MDFAGCVTVSPASSVGCASDWHAGGLGSIPGRARYFRGDWSRNDFYGHSSPTAVSSRAVVNYWRIFVMMMMAMFIGR